MNRLPPTLEPQRLSVRAAHPGESAIALRMIGDGQMPVETLRGDADTQGLHIALRDQKIVAASWLQTLTNEIGALWPPTHHVDAEAEWLLATEIARACRNNSFRLIRSMIPQDAPAMRVEWLLQVGLSKITRLVSLYWAEQDRVNARLTTPSITSNVLELQLVNIDHDAERIEQLMESTCIASLDCPELTERISAQAILESYIASPLYAAQRWYRVCLPHRSSEDVGLLMVGDDDESDQTELVYLGVTPTFRGHGYGAELVKLAQKFTVESGRRRMTVGVDIRNAPAMKIYQAAGFLPYTEHLLMADGG